MGGNELGVVAGKAAARLGKKQPKWPPVNQGVFSISANRPPLLAGTMQ
jgi:hypothetical protein